MPTGNPNSPISKSAKAALGREQDELGLACWGGVLLIKHGVAVVDRRAKRLTLTTCVFQVHT